MSNDHSLPAGARIGAVHLTISNLEQSLDFYEQALGFRRLGAGGREATLGADPQTPLLTLREEPGARPKPPHSTGLYHFAILFPQRAALALALQRLLALDIPLQGASDHLVSEAIYLADPDGNGIEIYADRPRQAWPRRHGRIEMATIPLDVEGLMAELGETQPPWQGLPAATTIGHIHLHVDDLNRAQAFYCDLLGFDLVTRYGPSALFVSAGGYHHHVGLNTWAGIGASPAPAGSAGLRFYDILLPAAGDYEALAARLQGAGVDFTRQEDGLRLADPAGNGIRIAHN